MSVDIGGTFTDLVLDTGDGIVSEKVLTTPHEPERGVLDGISMLLERTGVASGDIGLFIHGTTLATNALIERKGARTALLTTEGLRDILETGYEKRFEHYDIHLDRPVPLLPRHLRLTVRERMSARGDILQPLDEASFDGICQRLAEEEIEALAIGFIHSFAWPAHERRARDLVRERLPDLTITLSSDVSAEMREYERFSTAVANAYVQPLMAGYLGRLRQRLDEMGLGCPFFMMMSGGGLTTLEQARAVPVRLVESGPAGGAVLAGRIARREGLASVLAFDMGGTTAKVCLLRDGEPDRARLFEVARVYRDLKGSGLPVRIPVIEMVEIGAGGGSIGRIDAMGRITVGPDSAGADPGPACYGLGGTSATVTDANLLLGKLDPEGFARGRIRLDEERAGEAAGRDIGAKLGLDRIWSAAGMIEIVEENMANAAQVHAIERGRTLAEHVMIAFGGAAPLHAARLAQKLGIGEVIVPGGAGVGSAIGFLSAPLAYEIVRSRPVLLGGFAQAGIAAMIGEMIDEATVIVEPAAGGRELSTRIEVDLRYLGQGHELTFAAPWPLDSDSEAQLAAAFEEHYRRIYGVNVPGMPIEAVSWSVTVGTSVEADPAPPQPELFEAEMPKETRPLFDADAGEMLDAALYRRENLRAGAFGKGPCVIAEDETSTIVPRGFGFMIDGSGAIRLRRSGDGG
ncbi:MAG: hydantoinase/oxoprolinase family protein [Geminicoccaceae bacterium]